MTINEFNEKWTSSAEKDLNEWVASKVMYWSKNRDSSWNQPPNARNYHVTANHTPPSYLNNMNYALEVLDEISLHYEFLLYRDANSDKCTLQVGYNLLDIDNSRVLHECSSESSISRTICKVALLLKTGVKSTNGS